MSPKVPIHCLFSPKRSHATVIRTNVLLNFPMNVKKMKNELLVGAAVRKTRRTDGFARVNVKMIQKMGSKFVRVEGES